MAIKLSVGVYRMFLCRSRIIKQFTNYYETLSSVLYVMFVCYVFTYSTTSNGLRSRFYRIVSTIKYN